MLLKPHLYPPNYTKSKKRKQGEGVGVGTAWDFFASQFEP
jgi:hypothetical protein